MKEERFEDIKKILNDLGVADAGENWGKDDGLTSILKSLQNLKQVNQNKSTINTGEVNNQFKNLFNNLPNAIFIHDYNEITHVNNAFLEMFGYESANEIIGLSPVENIVCKDDHPLIKRIRARLKKEKIISIPKVRHLKKNGEVVCTETYVSNVLIDGKLHIQVVSRDIRERLKLENKLIESNEKYKGLFNSMMDLFTRVNNDGLVEVVSPSVYDLFGYTVDELIGGNTDDFYLDLADRDRFINEVKENGFCKNYEISMLAKNGDVKILSVNSKFYFDENGMPAGIESLSRDITKKRGIERSALRYGRIFEDSLNEVYIFDINSLKFVQVNKAAEDNIGYTIEELKTITPIDIKPEFNEIEFRKVLKPLLNHNKKKISLETKHKRKDGSLYDVEVHIQLLDYSDEKLFVAIILDITDKKKSDKNYKDIVNSLVDILIRVNGDGIVELVSPSVSLIDYVPEEILGKQVLNFYVNQEDRANYLNEIREKGFCNHFEAKIYSGKGKEIDVIANGKTYIDANGNIGIESIFRDITKLKKQHEKLVNNEYLLATINESLPDLILSVDSEFNILYLNKILEGYVLEELLGVSVLNFLPDNCKDSYGENIKKAFEGKHLEFEIEGYAENETLAWYSVNMSPIIEKGKIKSVLIIARNINDQKKTHDILEAVADIQDSFIGESSSRDSFDEMLDVLLRVTNSEYGFIGEVFYRDDMPYLKTHTITNISWNEETTKFYNENIEKGLEFTNLKSLFGKVMVAGEPVIANDPSTDPRRGGLPPGHPKMDSFLGLPFFNKGKILGMVGIANKPSGYTEEDVLMLAPFLTTCSTLIKAHQNSNKKDAIEKEANKLRNEFTNKLEARVKTRTLDLENAKKELAISLAKEKTLNELKSRFVSTASHQFRTPLSVIQSGIGILELQKGEMSEKLKKSFEKVYLRMRKQILNMTTLMDEVLVLGKISSGNKKADLTSINLESLCNDVVNNYNDIQTDGREMKVVVKGVYVAINLDRSLIEHALSNIISNAFKFSVGKSAPSLLISFTKLEVEICVTDNGIGIPKNELSHFFEPFYRASNVGGIHGTGLGTAIAKEYIELNNGTIEVSSKLNIGSKFVIRFKL